MKSTVRALTLGLAIAAATGASVAQAACAFRIELWGQGQAPESRVYRPKNINSAAACEKRARLHCGVYDRNAVKAQKITWDYAGEPEVAKWKSVSCRR